MSKVVFVGNVPYNMGEEQLIDVFKSVGQVVGFRLVFDRDTGKAKGYGFCEFSDHETALSAVRNLNNQDVGGRPLRIDLADSDPFLEGKTTVRGELMDGGYPGPAEPRSGWRGGGRGGGGGGGGRDDPEAFMANLPPGKPVPNGVSSLDAITGTLATMPPNQLLEVLAQMKAFIITHPTEARTLLQKHPQLSYALFQALLLHKIIPADILSKMQNAIAPSHGPPPPSSTPMPMDHSKRPAPRGAPLPQQAYPPPPHAGHPHPQQQQQMLPQQQQQQMYGYPPAPVPPTANMYAQPPPVMPPPSAVPPQAPGYYRQAPPPVPVQQQQQQPEVSDAQREMILQVLALTPETINGLPPDQKASILTLRNQFMGTMGNMAAP